MSKVSPIISIKGISKSYLISHRALRNAHPTIKDEIVRWLRMPLQFIGAAGGMNKERFYALKDIDIEIEPGEIVALMGINGSGKSTLLKILSRITQPDKGRVTFRGRMNSLLEVGTGFHVELTGRENIYFNGSILGMSKEEIDKKFDDIIEFSEIEDFLDTPVKFYSSGMRVRLAFSIAAHLEPEILLIDEVLAVGDVRFKQKSLRRMKEIAASGTTIVFVSHIIGHIQQICTKGIVLDKGQVVYDGGLEGGIEKYLELNQMDESQANAARSEESTEKNPDIDAGEIDANISDLKVSQKDKVPSLEFKLSLKNTNAKQHDNLWIGVMLVDEFGKDVAPINNDYVGQEISLNESDKVIEYKIEVPSLNVAPGDYSVILAVKDKRGGNVLIRKNRTASFNVAPFTNGMTRIDTKDKNSFHVVLDYKYNKLER